VNTLDFPQLIAAIKAGSKPARDELFRRYYDRLVRLAASMIGQFAVIRHVREPESVNSDLVIKLMRALEDPGVDLQTEDDFFRLAAHKLRYLLIDEADRRRTQNRRILAGHGHGQRETNTVGIRLNVEPPAPEHSSVANLEEWSIFHAQVKKLPADERQVVDLHLFQSLSQADVARRLGWTPKQVSRKWLAAATKLGDYIPGGPYVQTRKNSQKQVETENSDYFCPKC
jgi:RNA polymerase sigma factor (sigma-70 family)